ncbi:P-loop containing nucleoside triphosphate hydrolase protein [Whalleya microplaca]|nr:P-loop containing nucleoside triphosphate hydrolase protein [Whalleya microplaca]
METALEFHFQLAAKWNAIMLFDEADVFLEQRRGNDTSLDRNATVSILRRVLEYYDGILILTTNRIKAIDSAIVSRITVAILYQKLEDRARENVFKSFVERLDNEESRKRLLKWLDNEEWDKRFRRCPLDDLNGRQIRNVLTATSTLAEKNDDRAITIDDFHNILELLTKFQRQAKVWQKENSKRGSLQDVMD